VGTKRLQNIRHRKIKQQNKEEFEDTTGVIRLRKSKKDIQHIGQKKKKNDKIYQNNILIKLRG